MFIPFPISFFPRLSQRESHCSPRFCNLNVDHNSNGMFPLGQPWGTQQGSVWKEKRCAAHRTSLHSQISWLFLCFTSHHSRVCNLLLLKAASTWNHFLVCLLAGNFSQLFYLFETRSLPVSFCLKSSILTWNPLSVLPIYAEELALEDLLILRAPFSLLDS